MIFLSRDVFLPILENLLSDTIRGYRNHPKMVRPGSNGP
jgi:hypothetical protein